MKKLCFMVVLLVSLFASNCFGADGLTAFWLDARVVSQMANNGVSTLKIYAGMNNEGELCYLLVAGDSKYITTGSSVHMQNKKGVCPPQCEFSYVDLGEDNHSDITKSQATEYINRFMTTNPGMKNCARFTMPGMKILAASSSYIKVELGTKATATGLDEEGSANESSEVIGTLATAGI